MPNVKQMNSTMIVIILLGTIVVGGVGFFSGTLYQKSVTSKSVFGGQMLGGNFNRGTGGARGGTVGGANAVGGGRGGMGFRPVVGEILSKDEKSITVKLPDGSSKIVLLSATTAINKADKVDATGLVIGGTVRVIGTTNTDGSVTAQDIQLNPVQVGR